MCKRISKCSEMCECVQESDHWSCFCVVFRVSVQLRFHRRDQGLNEAPGRLFYSSKRWASISSGRGRFCWFDSSTLLSASWLVLKTEREGGSGGGENKAVNERLFNGGYVLKHQTVNRWFTVETLCYIFTHSLHPTSLMQQEIQRTAAQICCCCCFLMCEFCVSSAAVMF